VSFAKLEEAGLVDRTEQLASAFWMLRSRGHIDVIEISYHTGDPNETYTLRCEPAT
jgi:hypothetical protein